MAMVNTMRHLHSPIRTVEMAVETTSAVWKSDTVSFYDVMLKCKV
jgi:hypothetical protein